MSGGWSCLNLNISIHSPFGKHPLLSYCSNPCIPTLQSNLFPNLLQSWGLLLRFMDNPNVPAVHTDFRVLWALG